MRRPVLLGCVLVVGQRTSRFTLGTEFNWQICLAATDLINRLDTITDRTYAQSPEGSLTLANDNPLYEDPL